MKIAILDDYQNAALSLAGWASLGADVQVCPFARHLAGDEAARQLADFDVLCLMRERMQLGRQLIEQLPRLKLVTVTGSRMRCVDLAAASERGVTVCMTGGGDASSTVEHTLALILAAAKRIPQEDRNLRAGGWQQGLGMLLHGRTFGVLGLGRLGSAVAALGEALGMKVIAWSPNLTPERAAGKGTTYATRERFFSEADVLSIHMVLSDATRGLIGAPELALMKPTAILVNTSRGPLIDEAALVEALQARRIACAALDVFDVEPLPGSHPLAGLDNTVLTPHLGFVNDRSYADFHVRTVDTVRAWREGRPTGVVLAEHPPAAAEERHAR